ncbi:MAG: Rid family detoxifying hydrolase [Candidatus Bathyarchaeota archaeon]|nr:Rid family detoxifying hydrolase [Candidatus Bathyarchaeota archaeon]
MVKDVVKTDKAPLPMGPYSQAIKVGDFLFVSGQVSVDPVTAKPVLGDTKTQTIRILENLKAILNEAELTLENVVRVTVYLRNVKDFGEMNEVYKSYFRTDPPARSTVEVGLAGDFNVEIDAIAYSK